MAHGYHAYIAKATAMKLLVSHQPYLVQECMRAGRWIYSLSHYYIFSKVPPWIIYGFTCVIILLSCNHNNELQLDL